MRLPALLTALLLVCPWAPVRAAERDETAFQNVVVKPGDTLWGIAHKYLKDPARWDEILKHNKLPTSDPTVALPGLTLRVPVKLIKNSLRAAHLVYEVNHVLFRRRDTADWKDSSRDMELFQGDTLRTLEDSRARVKFLNKELLSLEPVSMAVIKPVEDAEADVVLKAGSVFTGHARVVTASARVTPRTMDTRYSASIEPDLTTRVEVFKGVAAVDAQGSSVDVPAGMQTRVRPGLAPEVPRRLENAPALEVRAQEFASAAAVGGGAAPTVRTEAIPVPSADAATLRGDIDSLSVGVPILGYHVQAASDREFKNIVFSRKYENDERFTPADTGLPPGAYWWRIAVVDLLGTEGTYSEGRYYTIGVKRSEQTKAKVALDELVTIISPESGAEVDDDKIRVIGVLRDDTLKLEVGGKPVRIDADGNFVAEVPLAAGVNEIELTVSDPKGDVTHISRRVTRR